jgi:hypothetical protein
MVGGKKRDEGKSKNIKRCDWRREKSRLGLAGKKWMKEKAKI